MSDLNNIQFVDEYLINNNEILETPPSSPIQLNKPPKIIRIQSFVQRQGFTLPLNLESKFQ